MNQFEEYLSKVKENSVESVLRKSILAYFENKSIVNLDNKSLDELTNYFDEFEYKEFNKKSSYFKQNIEDVINHWDKYLWVYNNLLEDEKSRQVYFCMIRAKIEINIGLIADAYEYLPTQYFSKDIYEFGPNEVYVDCGAYDGDTVEDFIKACPDYQKIYAYEAIPDVIKKAEIHLEPFNTDNSIVFRQYAVSDSEKVLSFSLGKMEGDSAVDDGGNVSVKATSLDKDLKDTKVTFIKMDIEGCEMEALHGAEMLIKQNEPKLAICIYHKAGDFWRLPEYVYSLSPNYRYKVRQYRKHEFYDTIMYCIPEVKHISDPLIAEELVIKRMKAILDKAVIIPKEDSTINENIDDARIWLMSGIAREIASRKNVEKDYLQISEENKNLFANYQEAVKQINMLEEKCLIADKIDFLLEKNQQMYADLNEMVVKLEKRMIERESLINSQKKEISELKNQILLKSNKILELEEERKTNLASIDFYIRHISNIMNIFCPQILECGYKIDDLINSRSLSRLLRIHAVGVHWKNTNFMGKVKLLIKLVLRPFGLKRNLYYEHESAYCRVQSNLISMKNIISAVNISIPSNYNSENNVLQESEVIKKKNCNKEELIAQSPLISVLLPVYNHAEFISDAIESVQCQTYDNWELLIINDGSTDNLLEKIEEYSKDPRIKIYSQENQRLPNTLTNLHNLANGQFITWTSADNVMEANMLDELSAELLKNRGAVMVFADVSIINENGSYISSGYREYNRDKDLPHIMRLPHSTDALGLECDNFVNACFLYRKEAVNALKGQYAADLEGLEDYDFWLRLQAFGEIIHIKNEVPLYKYRVHENTMSEDLLKNKRDLHVKRSEQLIDFSKLRQKFCDGNWNIKFIENSKKNEAFENILKDLNYDYSTESFKKFYYTEIWPSEDIQNNSLYVADSMNNYCIYFAAKDNSLENRACIYKGVNIPCIAKKVRQTLINGLFWEYPIEFAGYQVLGCHVDYNKIDIEKTVVFLNNNPDILFSFCAIPNGLNKAVVKKISESCKNALFMGEKEVGIPIYLYTSWDMMFIPPLNDKNADIMPSISLAWNIGRWIMAEDADLLPEILPLCCSYVYEEKLIGLKKIENINAVEEILDAYIYRYSLKGAVEYLLCCLNGIGQDIFVERPDFQLKPKQRVFPPKLLFHDFKVPDCLKENYVAIMVDSLDKGGLEQVVALIVREMTKREIEIKVLCTGKGGIIAEQLLSEGIEVICFQENREKFSRYIKSNPPILVNTHYTQNMLDIVSELKIPIVEVIHNMYVFFSDQDWKNERIRAKYFTKMIAVSELVKSTYLSKNPEVTQQKLCVIGNAVSASNLHGLRREFVRNILNLPKDSMLFINVSSIDGRKNQLGLLSAFDLYYRTVSQNAYLIIVGNVLSDFYDKELERYISELSCGSHLLKLNYHRNIADLYDAADVFVMPSYFEGWSMAATEALYCGLPIIHSLCGSAVELIDSGKQGVLIGNPAGNITECSLEELQGKMLCRIPENTEELVNAMRKMTEEREQWRQKSWKNKAVTLGKYCVSDMIDKYIECFREAIK